MIKKFDKFINENLNNDKLYNQLIDDVLTVADAFKPEVEFNNDGAFFVIELEDDNVLRDIEIEERGKSQIVNIVSINVQMYAFGKPMYIFFTEEDEHFHVEFNSIVNKQGFLELLKVE